MDNPRSNGVASVTGQLLPGPDIKHFMRLVGSALRLSAVTHVFSLEPETASFAARPCHAYSFLSSHSFFPTLRSLKVDINQGWVQIYLSFALQSFPFYSPPHSFLRPLTSHYYRYPVLSTSFLYCRLFSHRRIVTTFFQIQ